MSNQAQPTRQFGHAEASELDLSGETCVRCKPVLSMGSFRRAYPESLMAWRWAFGVSAAVALGAPTLAQEAMRQSLAGADAATARRAQAQSQAASLKTGDLKVAIRPTLGIRYNDNIATTSDNRLSDGVARPMLDVTASYPVTERNVLSLSVGIGYDIYFDHSEFNDLVLRQGSSVGFDAYVGEVWLNLHNHFSYVQDPANNPAVSGTAQYVGFSNTAGLSATWDSQNLVLTVGYDHYIFIAANDEFDYLDRSTGLPMIRAGYRFDASLLGGLEVTGSFNTYREQVLNDSSGLSLGTYVDWQVSEYLTVAPRAGYTAYSFRQTSSFIPAEDTGAWYASIRAEHRLNAVITYSLDAGHELRLGTYSDLIRAWFVRPRINLDILKDTPITLGFPYEHGSYEGGLSDERYDWFGVDVGVRRQVAERLFARLDYRLRMRGSSTGGDYTQNVVELTMSYHL